LPASVLDAVGVAFTGALVLVVVFTVAELVSWTCGSGIPGGYSGVRGNPEAVDAGEGALDDTSDTSESESVRGPHVLPPSSS